MVDETNNKVIQLGLELNQWLFYFATNFQNPLWNRGQHCSFTITEGVSGDSGLPSAAVRNASHMCSGTTRLLYKYMKSFRGFWNSSLKHLQGLINQGEGMWLPLTIMYLHAKFFPSTNRFWSRAWTEKARILWIWITRSELYCSLLAAASICVMYHWIHAWPHLTVPWLAFSPSCSSISWTMSWAMSAP